MKIVVPSRRRSHNMPRLLRLVPSAIICVEDSEVEDYARFVPRNQILPHPPLEGRAAGVYNWMLVNVECEILVRMDEDLQCVLSCVMRHRKLNDPEAIYALIENSARNCKDLGLSVFCFARSPNYALTHPEEQPIRPVELVAGCFGVMNGARYREMDCAMGCRSDLDFTMETLLNERCIYADVRFHFDFGLAGAGRGGGVGLTTSADMARATRLLRIKWGRFISEPNGQPIGKRKRVSQRAVKIKPNLRKNSRAHK